MSVWRSWSLPKRLTVENPITITFSPRARVTLDGRDPDLVILDEYIRDDPPPDFSIEQVRDFFRRLSQERY